MRMIKNYLVLALVLCAGVNQSFGQLCNGFLTTQTAIDEFATTYPDCSAFGQLTINDDGTDPITNLDGLSSITSFSGNLSLIRNFSLTDISGLSNVTSIGGRLGINDCDLLTNIDAFSNVTSIPGGIQIWLNDALLNVDGLSNVTGSLGQISFATNNSLESIDGISGITGPTDRINISSNNNIASLDALSGVTAVTGSLGIFISLTSAPNLDGLSNITEINGGLSILATPFTNLDAFSNITSINGNVDLAINSNLVDITGLGNINSVAGDFEISGNFSLTECCPIYDLVNTPGAVEGVIDISNGSNGCSLATITPCILDVDGDGFLSDVDCNDADNTIYPGAPELCDGQDNDCDGVIPADEIDSDEDGFSVCEGDCDDTNGAINPEAVEVPYDGVDNDCDSATLDDDLDEDGFVLEEDCDDTSAEANPEGTEIPYDGLDNDCNPATLDDDLDEDGFGILTDCDDTNPEVNPDAIEVIYDGIENDCDPETYDDDLDEDGFNLVDDCNDLDDTINPDATEVPYDGIDNDCNPATLDDDLDGDGFGIAEDCDDSNSAINPDEAEILNDGIDNDCNPETLDEPSITDGDGDGFASDVDCDDNDAEVNPNATEVPYDGVDNDCDPATLDDDLDEDGVGFAEDCDDTNPAVGIPTEINVPYTYDGSGDFCWVTTDNLEVVNSWALDYLIINGVDLTNTYSNNLPPKIDGEYLIEFSSSVSWGHFEASGSSGENNNSCDEPVSISIPFEQDGSGDFCWVTTEDIGFVNSWALTSLIINGEDFTNMWSNNLPPKIDGEYTIEYSGNVAWAHFEANPPTTNLVEQDNESQQSTIATSDNDELNLEENSSIDLEGTDSAKILATSFKVYPNPAKEELFLQMNEFVGEDVSISLVNQFGQILYSLNKTNLKTSTLNIPLNEFGGGMYYIRLIVGENELVNKSFIIQK